MALKFYIQHCEMRQWSRLTIQDKLDPQLRQFSDEIINQGPYLCITLSPCPT